MTYRNEHSCGWPKQQQRWCQRHMLPHNNLGVNYRTQFHKGSDCVDYFLVPHAANRLPSDGKLISPAMNRIWQLCTQEGKGCSYKPLAAELQYIEILWSGTYIGCLCIVWGDGWQTGRAPLTPSLFLLRQFSGSSLSRGAAPIVSVSAPPPSPLLMQHDAPTKVRHLHAIMIVIMISYHWSTAWQMPLATSCLSQRPPTLFDNSVLEGGADVSVSVSATFYPILPIVYSFVKTYPCIWIITQHCSRLYDPWVAEEHCTAVCFLMHTYMWHFYVLGGAWRAWTGVDNLTIIIPKNNTSGYEFMCRSADLV